MKNESNAVETANITAEEAKAKIAEIKSKLENPELSQEDFRKLKAELRDAEDDLELVELRARAMASREAEKAEADRRESLLSLQRDLRIASDTKDIEKLLDKVSDSVDKFLGAVAARNANLSRIGDELQNGAFVEGSSGIIGDLPASVDSSGVHISGVSAAQFSAKQRLDQAIRETSLKHFPRGLY